MTPSPRDMPPVGPQPNNHDPSHHGIVLPDGTPATKPDPLHVAQDMAPLVVAQMVQLPVHMTLCVEALDAHLLKNPEEGTAPNVIRRMEVMRAIGRWQDEAREIMTRHAQDHADEEADRRRRAASEFDSQADGGE